MSDHGDCNRVLPRMGMRSIAETLGISLTSRARNELKVAVFNYPTFT